MSEFIKTIRTRSQQVPLFFRQAVKFGLVGVLNTGVDLGIFFLLTHFIPFFAVQSTFAKAISYSAGILNSFFWNRTWTFQANDSSWKTMLSFIVVNLIGLGINTGLYDLSLNIIHLPRILALGLATVGTLALNFVATKFIVFRK